LKLEIWAAEEYFAVLYKNQNNGYTPLIIANPLLNLLSVTLSTGLLKGN